MFVVSGHIFSQHYITLLCLVPCNFVTTFTGHQNIVWLQNQQHCYSIYSFDYIYIKKLILFKFYNILIVILFSLI